MVSTLKLLTMSIHSTCSFHTSTVSCNASQNVQHIVVCLDSYLLEGDVVLEKHGKWLPMMSKSGAVGKRDMGVSLSRWLEVAASSRKGIYDKRSKTMYFLLYFFLHTPGGIPRKHYPGKHSYYSLRSTQRHVHIGPRHCLTSPLRSVHILHTSINRS